MHFKELEMSQMCLKATDMNINWEQHHSRVVVVIVGRQEAKSPVWTNNMKIIINPLPAAATLHVYKFLLKPKI